MRRRKNGAQLDAAGALVPGVDGAFGSGIVELLHPAADHHVVQALEAVVDLGSLEGDGADGRDVADQERRPAARLHLRHRAHGHAVAVGELEPSVDPALGLGGQLLGGQLAGGEHDLPQLVAYQVAVGVDGQEVVVEPEELDLVVALEQRALVPQPHVAEGAVVVGHDSPVDPPSAGWLRAWRRRGRRPGGCGGCCWPGTGRSRASSAGSTWSRCTAPAVTPPITMLSSHPERDRPDEDPVPPGRSPPYEDEPGAHQRHHRHDRPARQVHPVVGVAHAVHGAGGRV
jgi:hypothetical protein